MPLVSWAARVCVTVQTKPTYKKVDQTMKVLKRESVKSIIPPYPYTSFSLKAQITDLLASTHVYNL